MNGATFASGKVGQAFSFNDVDAFVEVGVMNIGDLQQLTIETWVKLDAFLALGQRFVSLSSGTPLEKAVLNYSGGELKFSILTCLIANNLLGNYSATLRQYIG